ncbi:MAG: transcriptional activator domain [Cyanobacteria bacterium RYN_339]|nr:transcriptional activator domain [Cyanobacteria bacterium RYN_339]
MNETWIVQSKLTPPSPPDGWLTRELLPAGLPTPPLTLLVAGPGYGKTLGLLSIVKPALERGAPVLWYTLDMYDADPATFFHYMVAGMREHIPQFGEEVKALLMGERLEPRLLWQRFFQSLVSYNLPEVFVVLDDFHHLQEHQPELVKALAYFFDKLPPRMHVLLGSRRRINAPMSKAQAMGLVRVIEQENLRFNSMEEVEFMRGRAPEGKIPNHWWKQATGLDGWPLGLDLATSVAEEREMKLDPRTGGVEVLMGYVAEEIYESQPQERRDFMLRAALLGELTPEACRAVFEAADAVEQLDVMEANHLVRRLTGGVGYRFPTYLKDMLLAEAERTIPGPQLDAWHRQAGTFFRDRGQIELALPHLIASKDWDGASLACEMSFPAMRFSGRQAQIMRWLDAFPADVTEREPVLQLWRGHQLSRGGQHVDAIPAYEKAKDLFVERKDAAGIFKVQVRLCTITLIHQDMRKFGASMLQALANQRDGKNEDIVDLHLARALAAEQRGDLAMMEECNQAVMHIPVEKNIEIAASQTIALMNLFTLNMHRGDLAASARHIAHAIELADQWDFYPYKLFASFLQAHLRILEGDVEPAAAFIRGLQPHWKDLMDWHDLACAYTTMGFLHQARGEWKEAEDDLRRSQATFEKAGFKEGKKVSLERLLWLAVQRKQLARVPELLAEAGDAAVENIYDLALMPPYARALHLQGNASGALKIYEKAIPGFEAARAELHLARTLLYEGATHLKLGDDSTARAAIARGMALAESRNFRFLPAQDPQLWEEIAPVVAKHRIAVSFVEQSLSAAAQHEVTLLLPAVEAAPKAKVLVVAPAAVGRLSIRCFGGFEVRLDGVLLDQWPRRKAKLIMAALLLYPRGLGLAQLGEILGPGEDITQASLTTLKVDVSALRKSLEPAMGKGATSKYVVTQDDRYLVDWDTVEYLDMRLFDVAIGQADRLRDNDEVGAAQSYEQALGHYRGNLLDDGFFQKYFEAEREKYRQQVVAALLWLARFHQKRGDMSSAEASLVRAVELAPCEEEAYIALMRFQKNTGRSERIRQVYWDCRKALKAYLGMTPSEEFEAAYQGIAKGA